MIPYLVTPPVTLPVSLPEMKAHLRVDGDDEDALIESLQMGAVAMLEGWGGVLGRCILPQFWAIDVTGPGPHPLPFPDASEIVAEVSGAPLDVLVKMGGAGVEVSIHDAPADQAVTIKAKYGLPDERRAAAEVLVKLIVGNWFENREAVVVGTIAAELPMAANALIATLRWMRI